MKKKIEFDNGFRGLFLYGAHVDHIDQIVIDKVLWVYQGSFISTHDFCFEVGI